MQEVLFEWIVVCGKQEYCLTENQYNHLLKNQDKRIVAYDNFSINPAYISSSYKQPAKKLKSIYPCLKCDKTGFVFKEEKRLGFQGIEQTKYEKDKCPACSGTGIDLKVRPNTNALTLLE